MVIALSALMIFSGSVKAVDFDIIAKSAILVDAKTGQILFQKNEHKKLPPASMTKIMTILLTFEALDRGEVSLDDMVSVSAHAESMGGSQIYLSSDDRLSLRTLLKSVIIASANDACVAMGEYIGGTEANFVRMMNNRAQELGMVDTQFKNTTGLPAKGHYSTAYDISLMARKLIKYEQFREWAQIWHDTVEVHDGERSLTNTNTLIRQYPNLDGVKTGHTNEAGFCLAASAKNDGFRLVSVIMNTKSERQRNESTTRLLDYGFRAFEHKVVVKKNETVEDVAIEKGKEESVGAYTAESLEVVISKGATNDLTRDIKALNKTAPIEKGEKIGELIVYQNDKELGRVDLLANEKVEKANIFILFFRWLWKAIMNLIGNITG